MKTTTDTNWTPELVQQLLDLGFGVDRTRLSCSINFDVYCGRCPLAAANDTRCNERYFSKNPDLLTILQIHHPELLL